MRLVAEIGVNHDGKLDKALALVDAAASAGATHVKFQYFDSSDLVAPHAGLVDYQKAGTGPATDQLGLLKPLELDLFQLEILYARARTLGLTPFSTVFSAEMLKDVAEMGQEVYKIPSGEITNFQLLGAVCQVAKEVLLSTGMSYLSEVAKAVEFIEAKGVERSNITVMQCTSSYPAPPEALNLSSLAGLAQSLGTPVGFSDHSLSSVGAVLAVAFGARTFEKHLTLDKRGSGPDHSASLEPNEFLSYSATIDEAILSLGSSLKAPNELEFQARGLVRRRVVARSKIRPGELLSAENTALRRSDCGFVAELYSWVIGTVAPRGYEVGEGISW